MSLTKTQIDNLINRNCKTNNVSYPISEKTEDENIALSDAWNIIFTAGGKWQWDDSNHEDYPFITTNMIAGQRDYSFVSDESGNLILDIYKVMVKDEQGIYHEIYPVDQQTDYYTESFYDGRNLQGLPNRYDKTANGIFLDLIPSYNSTDGLKIFINREGSYFTTSDTTKMPGFSGLFHKYVAISPSYQYAMRNGLDNKNDLLNEKMAIESAMRKHFRDRTKDETNIISSEPICSI